MKNRPTIFVIMCLCLTIGSGTQVYSQTFSMQYWSCDSYYSGRLVMQTPDRGYLVNCGDAIIKVNNAGGIEWQNHYHTITYGTRSRDGSYIFGTTRSFTKINENGTVLWSYNQPQYGYWYNNIGSIVPTDDGGFLTVGTAIWDNGNPMYDRSYWMWIQKFDLLGTRQWAKRYKEFDREPYGASITETADGNFILVGQTGYSPNNLTYLTFKLDSSGEVIWRRTYGGRGSKYPQKIISTIDGGVLIAGKSDYYSPSSLLLIKLDNQDAVEWQKEYDIETYIDIFQTDDGGYMVLGESLASCSLSGETCPRLLKLDATGTPVWMKRYDAGYPGGFNKFSTTTNNGFILAGGLNSNLWLLRTDGDGVPGSACTFDYSMTCDFFEAVYSTETLEYLIVDHGPTIDNNSDSPTPANITQYDQCSNLDVFELTCDPIFFYTDSQGTGRSECLVESFDWSGQVNFSCSGLPLGATCSFEPANVTLSSSDFQGTTMIVNYPIIDTPGEQYAFQAVGTNGGLISEVDLGFQIAQFDAIPNPVVCGPVEAGEEDIQTLSVKNIDTVGSVTLNQVGTPNNPFSIIANNCTGTELAPEEECQISISYAPVTVDNHTAKLSLHSTAGETVNVQLSGSSFSPSIALSLTSPQGGESWSYSADLETRKQQLIVWEYGYFFDLTRTRLSYSADGGSTWSCIADSDSQELKYTSSSSQLIPDDTTPAQSSVSVPDSVLVTDINVDVSITHPRVSDLILTLIGPSGTEVILSDQNGISGSNFQGTEFNDEAGQPLDSGGAPYSGFFRPDQPLDAFDGENSAGTWTLQAVDMVTGESGTIDSWSLVLGSCHNSNISGTGILLPGSTSFLWDLPTAEEAADSDQVLPSSECLVKIETWGQDTTTAEDVSPSTFYLVQPSTTSIQSLVLWDSVRMCQQYDDDLNPDCDCLTWENDPDCSLTPALQLKLNELADSEKISGVVLDLVAVPAIQTAYSNWDTTPLDQGLANTVSQEIRDYIHSQVNDTYSNVQYVILVGDDRQIPFFRMVDGTTIYPESGYPAEVGLDTTTTVGGAINQGYFFTDNYYTELSPEGSGLVSPHDTVYLNDLSCGRLVETPDQISSVISAFLAFSGQVELTAPSDSILVTGFDFFYDSAVKIRDIYESSKTTDCLLDDPDRVGTIDPCDDLPYTPADLENALFSSPHEVTALHTHAHHYGFAASSGTPSVLTTDTMDLNLSSLNGTILYTSGCHSGLTAPPADPNPLDLPELMATKKVLAYIGNTGYGWGMKNGQGLSEVLMEKMSEELMTNSSITIGKALAQAKRTYYLENLRYDVFDEKVLHEWTLFGIPNTLLITEISKKPAVDRQNLPPPSGPARGCAQGICLEKQLLTSDEIKSLPPGMTELDLNFTFGAETYTRITTTDGDYFELNRRSSGEVGDAVQPHFVYNSSLSGTNAHGVVFLGGSYTTEAAFNPVVGVPHSTNYVSDEGTLPMSSTFTPRVRISYGTTGGSAQKDVGETGYTNMVVHTGYFDESQNQEYLFDTMSFIIFYYNGGDIDSPVITDPGAGGFHTVSSDGLTATFSVPVSDTSGIYRVLITFDNKQAGHWESLSLTESDGVWTGTLDLNGSILYYVQAIDNVGNVEILSLQGDDLDQHGTPYGSRWNGPKTYSIIVADTDSDGLSDAYENTYSCLDSGSNDADGDPDFDLLTNTEEYSYNTHPCLGDSDGGGDNDGSERSNNRNPRDKMDDKHLTLEVTKAGSSATIAWGDTLGDNDIIEGYYFIYKSDTPFFSMSDLAFGPLPDTTKSQADSNPSCNLCFYKLLNYMITTEHPSVESIVPSSGPAMTATDITVFGNHFQAGASVTLCGSSVASNVVVHNESRITCTTPALESGYCDITVTNPNAQSGTMINGYLFQ